MKVRTLYLPVRTRAGEITDNTTWAFTSLLKSRGYMWWQEAPVFRGRDVSDTLAHPVAVMVTDKQWEAVLTEAFKLFGDQELLVVVNGDGRYVSVDKP